MSRRSSTSPRRSWGRWRAVAHANRRGASPCAPSRASRAARGARQRTVERPRLRHHRPIGMAHQASNAAAPSSLPCRRTSAAEYRRRAAHLPARNTHSCAVPPPHRDPGNARPLNSPKPASTTTASGACCPLRRGLGHRHRCPARVLSVRHEDIGDIPGSGHG
jgi:hypothetical protein